MLKSMFLIRYILVYFGIFDPQPIINQGYSDYQSFWICLSSLKLPITLDYKLRTEIGIGRNMDS